MPSAETKQNRKSKTLTSRREDISEQDEGNKQSQLAYTANKATEAPVLGWPARPRQPTMHRECDGGEAPREKASHRVTRRRRELNRASIRPHRTSKPHHRPNQAAGMASAYRCGQFALLLVEPF